MFRKVLSIALAAAAVLALAVAGEATGERHQQGNLIVSLDGGLRPLKLPRDRPAPVAVDLEGGLKTDDGTELPRVTRIELGMPTQAVFDTRGLPVCSPRRLRYTTPAEALEACGGARIGEGQLEAKVVAPNLSPLTIRARLLAFNGRVGGRRAVILHAYSTHLPIAVVLRFLVHRSGGRLGKTLVAELPGALGPWPRFARFEMRLGRRFRQGGEEHSYLRASCPIPRSLTAGFFSLARADFTLADGGTIGTGITRGCRAR